MSKTTRHIIIKAVIRIAIGGAILWGATAPPAHADPISNAGDDSWRATCTVLGKNLDGVVGDDTATLMGVAQAISQYYSTDLVTAARIVNYQVQTYCPLYWPNLVAVGQAARGTSM